MHFASLPVLLFGVEIHALITRNVARSDTVDMRYKLTGSLWVNGPLSFKQSVVAMWLYLTKSRYVKDQVPNKQVRSGTCTQSSKLYEYVVGGVCLNLQKVQSIRQHKVTKLIYFKKHQDNNYILLARVKP